MEQDCSQERKKQGYQKAFPDPHKKEDQGYGKKYYSQAYIKRKFRHVEYPGYKYSANVTIFSTVNPNSLKRSSAGADSPK
jgi:hypothetical protein